MMYQTIHADSRVRYALITAGGRGQRMGSAVPKQFLSLASEGIDEEQDMASSILACTLRCFAPIVKCIVLILPASEMHRASDLITACGLVPSSVQCVEGGDTRFASVRAGLSVVPDGALVAIHDGVRPFVSIPTIERCFERAASSGGAIPVIPLTDSIRRLRADGLSESVLRSDYVAVQTPQTFRSELIRQAYTLDDRPEFTDDASVFETYHNRSVVLVEGNVENIKITNPIDLRRMQRS